MKLHTLSRPEWVQGACACGAITFRIKYPARWAWHDHSLPGRLAHGAAYATYVGSWTKRFTLLGGEEELRRYHDGGTCRSFCGLCGTPVFYEREKSPHMINIPRALFEKGVGREPRYHVRIQDIPDWAWLGEKITPLKNAPSIMYEPPRKKKKRPVTAPGFPEPFR